MNLYIVRHGIALNVGEAGIKKDADRTLSPEGREKTKQAAEGLARLGCRPDRIATSPLPRARETAEIMAEVLNPKTEVEPCDFLLPGAAARDVLDWAAREGGDEIMIVGHAPDVETITAEWLTSGELDVTFKKSAACCVRFEEELEPGAGTLAWLIQPKALRLMRG